MWRWFILYALRVFSVGGIFLLLGYSSTDEALLRPHTNLGVQDAVRGLQQYVIQHINNQTQCALTLFNITDENIILSVRLPHDQKANAIDLLRKEKVSVYAEDHKKIYRI